MTNYYLVAHGDFDQKTRARVPKGMTIHYYAKEHQLITGATVWQILKNKENGPKSTFPGGSLSPNVDLGGMAGKDFIYQVKTSRQPGDKIICVGPMVKGANYTVTEGLLCNNPTGCAEKDQHDCGGVFEQLAKLGIDRIHMMVCLGDEEAAVPTSEENWTESGRKNTITRLHELHAKWYSLMLTNPEGALDWYNNAISTDTRDLLIAHYSDISKWRSILNETHAATAGGELYIRRFIGLEPDKRKLIGGQDTEFPGSLTRWLRGATKVIRSAVDVGQQGLELLGRKNPEKYIEWFTSLPKNARRGEIELLLRHDEDFLEEYEEMHEEEIIDLLRNFFSTQRKMRAEDGVPETSYAEIATQFTHGLSVAGMRGHKFSLKAAKRAKRTPDRTILDAAAFKMKILEAIHSKSNKTDS